VYAIATENRSAVEPLRSVDVARRALAPCASDEHRKQ
jgi:hypothetical protein